MAVDSGDILSAFANLLSAVLGAGAQWWFSNRKFRRLEVAQQAFGLQARRLGIHAKSIRTMLLVDLDGSQREVVEFKDITVTPGLRFDFIPAKSWNDRPHTSIRQGPELIYVGPFDKHVSIEADTSNPQDVLSRVVISGGLTAEDGPLSYSTQLIRENAFLTTKKAVVEATRDHPFKYEYESWDMNIVPTDSLEIVVQFPPALKASFFPGVFWGPYEWAFQHTELRRVRSGFNLQPPNGAAFRIDNPGVGFRYLIYWQLEH